MPQDKLVKLNRLPVERAGLGDFLVANHELVRRVLEGTYPDAQMTEELRRLCKLPKVDPQIHAAEMTAWALTDESRLRALTHLALSTKKWADISHALTCAELLKTKEAYNCIARLYYQSGARIEHTPLKAFLCANRIWKKLCDRLDCNLLWCKVFGIDELRFDTCQHDEWLAKCRQALTLGMNPLFDDYQLKLIKTAGWLAAPEDMDTVQTLCANIADYYAMAKALCLLDEFDNVRTKIKQGWEDLLEATFASRTQGYAFDRIFLLLAASELFKHTKEPQDLAFVKDLLYVGGTECDPPNETAYCNQAAVEVFRREFWQNVAEGVEPKENLATTGRNLLKKMRGADAECLTMLQPDSWLNIYLQPYFHFNDETCDPDHPVFDPERHKYSPSQKIAAYLMMAEDWPGDTSKREHLERAYNYALTLSPSYYKVLVLCDIYELKVRFGLDTKNKRD